MQPAPILVFAYNRPEKLLQTLISLKECPEFDESAVSIFVDGPKDDTDRYKVDQVRDIARSFDACNVTMHFRELNAGLKKSIRAGVNATFEKHEMAIIIEDDLRIAPTGLSYFNRALEKYQNCERVWSISGYMHEVPQFADRNEALFLPMPHPWGWATWRRSWNRPEVQPNRRNALLKSSSFRTYFDALGYRDYAAILALDEKELVNSWFMHWYLKMFENSGLSLWPPRSLITNNGIASGTHASSFNFHRFLPRSPLPFSFHPELPAEVAIDFNALDFIRASRDVRLTRVVSRLGGHKRILKSLIAK